jgi:hypothetical protein
MYFFWATNWFMPVSELTGGQYIPPPFFEQSPVSFNSTGSIDGIVFSSLQNCQMKNSGKYYFS